MTETDWYKKLSVGDKVVVDNGRGGLGIRYNIGTVTKVTPTKMIQVDNKETKFKNGMILGNRYKETKVIHPFDSVWAEVAFRCWAVWQLENTNFNNHSTEELKGIVKVLGWEYVKQQL